MLSMTASDMSCRSTSSRSFARRSSAHGCPGGMSKRAPTIPHTAGICLMYESGIGSRGPNHRKVIILWTRLKIAILIDSSPRHSQACTTQQLLDFTAGNETEISGDTVLQCREGGCKADGVLPATILETAHDQPRAEGVASTNAINDLHFVAWRAVDLVIRDDDRAPVIQQNPWVFAQRDGDGTQVEPLLEIARDTRIRIGLDVLVPITRLGADAEDYACVLLRRYEDIHVLHQRFLNRARLLGAPQFAAIVQIVTDRKARFLRCHHGFPSN